jgi:nucleotide-binding universal stress UspA family protein
MIEIGKILCPVDFSERSDYALQFAVSLAQMFKAQLEILHVLQPPMPFGAGSEGLGSAIEEIDMEPVKQQCEAQLARMVESVRGDYADVEGHHAVGVPFVEIVKRAREKRADLIVMGTHGRTGLAHVLIGSVAERVVRKAPCPVLTVKPHGEAFVMP